MIPPSGSSSRREPEGTPDKELRRLRAGLRRMRTDPSERDRIAAIAAEAVTDELPAVDQLPVEDELAVREVAELAIRVHDGQQDMYGGPYSGHLRAVAEALTPFGPQLEMAGWLHDILEKTALTADELREAGVPDRVVEIVERVTQVPGSDYLDSIRLITQDPEATLVKIADNADSIHPERTPVIPDSDKLLADFEQARAILWSATTPEKVTAIVRRVNPPLLERRSAGQEVTRSARWTGPLERVPNVSRLGKSEGMEMADDRPAPRFIGGATEVLRSVPGRSGGGAAPPIHEGERLGFGGPGLDREECWARLPDRVKERVNARVGSFLDWWASMDDGEVSAVVLGARAFVIVRPVPTTESGHTHRISSLLLVEPSARKINIREPDLSGRGTAGPAPREASAASSRLDAHTAGIFGNLPPRAQRLLQEPFSGEDGELWYESYYLRHGGHGLGGATLQYWFYLTDRRFVTFAGGTGYGFSESTGPSSWDLVCWRVKVAARAVLQEEDI